MVKTFLHNKIEDLSYRYERVTGAEEDLSELKKLIKKMKKKEGKIPAWMKKTLTW